MRILPDETKFRHLTQSARLKAGKFDTMARSLSFVCAHVNSSAIWSQYTATRSRQIHGWSVPGAGRRQIRQNARHHAEDCASDRRMRLRIKAYRRADFHQ